MREAANNFGHELLWQVKTGDEPIYSTPIFAIFSNGQRVLIYQSWDWYLYVRVAETGKLVWRYLFGAPNYGRPQGWIQRFNGVATKYLNNYLTWFQVLESIHHQRNEVTMNDLIIKGNLVQNAETYDTLRLNKFAL